MSRRRATPQLQAAINSLRHGATARAAILPGEDPDDHARLITACLEALTTPQSSDLARRLVLHVASTLWRLERLERWEAAILAQHPEGPPPELDLISRYEASLTRSLLRLVDVLARLSPAAQDRALHSARNTARATIAHLSTL